MWNRPPAAASVIATTIVHGGADAKTFLLSGTRRRYSSSVQNEPPYPLRSVDNALRLAQLLQTEGSLRLTDAAARLNVAPSTAHRLLAMLVYRDFAHQRSDRTYAPGRALRPLAPADAPVPLLRELCVVPMHALVDRVQESVHLMVLAGADVRFIATVECRRVLGVGDRTGRTLPAHITSGGKAMLAAFSRAQLDERYAEMPPTELGEDCVASSPSSAAVATRSTTNRPRPGSRPSVLPSTTAKAGPKRPSASPCRRLASTATDLTELVAALHDTTHAIEQLLAVAAQSEAS